MNAQIPRADALRMEAMLANAMPRLIKAPPAKRTFGADTKRGRLEQASLERRVIVAEYIRTAGPDVPFSQIRDHFADRFKRGVLSNDMAALKKSGAITARKEGDNESLYTAGGAE